MRRVLTVVLTAALLVAVVSWLSAGAQEQKQQYTLKDYMPQTVGSKWTMKATGGRAEEIVTYEVQKAVDVNGEQVPPIVMKGPDGNVRRGSLELVTEDNLTLYGSIFGGRGQQAGAQPTTILYDPAAVFPGKMTVGQTEEATVKATMGQQPGELKIKLELAAVESVTVPKGTFDDCLKLVYTTSFGTREMKRTQWYAKGVGLVRTENPGFGQNPTLRVSELTDYQLAE